MRDTVWYILLLTFPALILLHLSVAPYTKVEESFHIQAIHDLLHSGIPTRNVSATLQAEYDHFSYPGPVPRTFIGAVMLSGLSRPWLALKADIDRQWLARAILGICNALSLMSFTSGVRRAFGKTTAVWYLLLQASQFHVIYYASRTLSNMFAFGITTLALRCLLPEPVPLTTYRKRCKLSLFLLTIAGIIFRSELALLLATVTVYLYATQRITITGEILPAGIVGLLTGLSFTVSIDSFFWQRFPLWPELSAFSFNVLHGQSSAWGTSPWHFYFTSAVPRLLLNPLTYPLLIPLSLMLPATRRSSISLLAPSLSFISLYSVVPHKEWRFIIYTIPALTLSAAQSASYLWTHRSKSLLVTLTSLSLVLSVVLTSLISNAFLLPISAANYPGAEALKTLHAHAHNTKPVITVYLGNLATQTGVTRFVQAPPRDRITVMVPERGSIVPEIKAVRSDWVYEKNDDPVVLSAPGFWDQFEYVLAEVGSEEKGFAGWEEVSVVDAFGGLRVLRKGDSAGEGTVEEGVLRGVFGESAVRWYRWGVEVVRGGNGGWWVETRMEPRIRILKRPDTTV